LDCHKEIKKLIEQKRGYHAGKDVLGKDCYACHGEHFGRDFHIVEFNKEKFDHLLTGFKLDGKHEKIKCEKCHKKEFIKNSDFKKRDHTFLGMERKCKSCHQDYHQGSLEDDCASCHNTEKFRPAPGFIHDKTKFKLTGAHIKTDCEKCHKKIIRNNKEFQQFAKVKFNSCENCHKDEHNGKFGNNCTNCHVTSSFRNIGNRKNFDHNKTNFPLVGKHVSVNCNDCHGSKLSSKPKHSYCIDCHKDFHKGEIKTAKGGIEDCADCHSVQGYRPSKFTIEKHSKLKFALEGSHLAVPCAACHLKKTNWKFKFSGTKCADCHKNIHEKFVDAKFTKDGCENCHNTNSWHKIAKFDHSKTKFKLEGKHKETDCAKCHFKDQGKLVSQQFKSLDVNCESCHADIHFGQFKEGGGTECSKCHTPANWNPVKFNHETTRFPLEGAHSKVQCYECHKSAESNTNRYVQFKIEDIRCASCHSY